LLISFLLTFAYPIFTTTMIVLKTVREVDQHKQQNNSIDSSLGFVPTMGALHEGHLSLVRRAKLENEVVAVSIYVNPKQFNNPEDLKHYPRTIDQDLDLLSGILDHNDFVFTPSDEEMYPDQIMEKYDFGLLETIMEGKHRPGHFNGVGIVVDRLFQIIRPKRSYFGEKDFQQIAVIKDLIRQKDYDIEIIPCSIIREKNGLAMSSRNVRLTQDERQKAGKIFYLLNEARQRVLANIDLLKIQDYMINELNNQANFSVEYVAFAEEEGLKPTTRIGDKKLRCFVAVFAGDVRLIDNYPMY
jgi:pantoate--beta-alanine ligase